MSRTASRPILVRTFSRRTVTGLSAMIWDVFSRPLVADGSTVTRKSGASVNVDVIWHTTTDACPSRERVALDNHGRPRLAVVT